MAKKKETKPEVAKEEPKVDNTVEKLKIKKPKPKKFTNTNEDNTVKIDLKELASKAEDVVKVDLKNPKVEEVKQVEEIKEPKGTMYPVSYLFVIVS